MFDHLRVALIQSTLLPQAKLKELGLNMKRGEVLDRSEAISIALEKGGSSR